MKRYWKYIRPYLPAFIIGPILMIVEVIGEVVMPLLLKQIIDEYDKEYKEWKCSSTGSLWNRSSSLNYTNV